MPRPPLSDDEYTAQFREAYARAEFAMYGHAGSWAQFWTTCEKTAQAMQELGLSMEEARELMEAALSPAERARYDELRALGMLPFDASAYLDASDDTIAAFLSTDRDADD